LRLARAADPWWRIETDHPDDWSWTPFPVPRHRFDPVSGRFRMRYAANRVGVAARERFPARVITEGDGDLWVVRIDRMPSALHLTHQANLDALGVDDRVSTGRIPVDRIADPDPLLDVCGRLADAVFDWWHGQPPPLVYRSRTTPVGRNIAFSNISSIRAAAAGRLRDATALHAYLVLQAGFTIPHTWLT